MAHPFVQHSDLAVMSRPSAYSCSLRTDESDATRPDIEIPAETAASERTNRRVWRAISWILLANVVLFWLLTCITAFAQTAGN